MYRIIGCILSLMIIVSCGNKKEYQAQSEVLDKCELIDKTLVGVFSNDLQEGTMTWSGGLNGSVDIAGPDYNDIVCTYIISDCESNQINMNCNGAPYDSELIVYNRDSMKLGMIVYTRVK